MLQTSGSAPLPNPPQYLSLPHLLDAQARRNADALALLVPERPLLPYGRLWRHVDEVVRTLHALGVGRHDRVALVLPHGPELATAFLGVAAAATCAPLNPDYSANDFAFYLADLHAKALILQAGMDSPARAVAEAQGVRILELSPILEAEAGCFTLTSEARPAAMHHERAQPDDVALVLYTTGTTSRPKRVPLTHANLCTAAHNTRLALTLVEDDRCLNVMPLFHTHGLGALLASLMAGASVVCLPGFSAPLFFECMAAFHPTWYTAVPTIHQAILARAAVHREMIARCPLRFIRSGSMACPPQVLAELERVFHAPVIEYYGMTEAASQITCNPLPPRARKIGSVGVAIGVDVAIMAEGEALLPGGETGEIVVRGGSVMQSYDNDPEANGRAFIQGWFRTGDQGFFDADGFLCITGRLKEIINRGGEKIAPREVDDVLMDHPAVAQALTFAVPDARLGEDIAAAVVLRQHTAATESEIRQFATTRLAAFKVPRRVLIVEDLPQGPTGKLQRLGLAAKLGLTTPEPAQPTDYTAPRTAVEAVLARIWAQVLGLEGVGRHGDFFRLGGDSLLATQMLSRVREALQVELPLHSLFEAPTIAMLAEHVETALWAARGLQAPPTSMADSHEEIAF